MNARTLPDTPAQPEHATDATGVLTGNSDLSGVPDWRPWPGAAERPTLPGHEHQIDPASWVEPLARKALFAWGVVGWLVVIPIALMRLGGAQ
ncbi:hypothetical protein H9645_03755 [Luteimonas sp. Sa2BVA3]|uniref:Uncharacterized protein n=1 Tax=Luteimonas colneyensis TaxID=2762230 RepID=A0ABR8UGI5_9GAMM|nr:hypothetical protein [Luteimonas colneyensis]MBD7987137.1 hypothetical protein [Luteimonas colneyensis]